MSMDESALKSHFEVILGRPLEIGEGIPIRIDVGTSNQEVNASVTSRNLGTTGESTKTCLRHLMLDVTGTARTGPDGRVSFLLSDFHCLDNVPFQGPLNFVATPLEPRQSSAGPVFLTATRFLNPPGDDDDVRIIVKSWGATGTPVGNIAFDWRCRVGFEQIG